MATCEGLLHRLGFDCRAVGDQTLAVTTPFVFADGEPIAFYLDEFADSVRVSDNADTLAHFASIGLDITERRRWRGVRQAVEQFGLKLIDSGEIVGQAPANAENRLVMEFLSAMLAVVSFERDFLGIGEELEQYIAEVEMYLRAWKPDAPLEYAPQVVGHSGREYSYHFQFDGQLVDAARPHGTRTGAILRKSADIINAGETRTILVIMDDREDEKRAKVESDILSTMVSVMSFTQLASKAGGNLTPQ